MTVSHHVSDRRLSPNQIGAPAASAAMYQALLDGLPDAAWVRDLDCRYLAVNRAFIDLLCGGQAAREDVVGKTDSDLFPQQVAGRLRSQALATIREERKVTVELQLPLSGRSACWLRLTEAPLRDAAGAVIGTVSTARDVTAERQLRDDPGRAWHPPTLAALLYGLGHELNNPLNTVLNFAQLLLMDPRPEDDRDALEAIQRETERAAQAVSDLRLLARQVSGTGAARESVSLSQAVRHVLKLRRYLSTARGSEVSADLPAQLPKVSVDRARLEPALIALLLQVEREAAGRPLRLRTYAATDAVALEIAVAEPTTARETSPADAVDAEPILSLALAIAQEHGGEARIVRRDGGVIVTVLVPCASPSDHDPPRSRSAAPRPLRILIVDDEASIRCSIQRYLERRGHQVEVARDGAEALALLQSPTREAKYDAILSDLRMPGLDGKQLLDCLRERGSDLEERVLFMTGDALSGDATWIAETTGVPVLSKPIDLREIARMVERPPADERPHA